MVNLYAVRSTDPTQLAKFRDPVGPDNDEAIASMVGGAELVVVAWGNQGHRSERAGEVLRLIGSPVHCLGRTATGAPRHPLYAKSTLLPELFRYPLAKTG